MGITSLVIGESEIECKCLGVVSRQGGPVKYFPSKVEGARMELVCRAV